MGVVQRMGFKHPDNKVRKARANFRIMHDFLINLGLMHEFVVKIPASLSLRWLSPQGCRRVFAIIRL